MSLGVILSQFSDKSYFPKTRMMELSDDEDLA